MKKYLIILIILLLPMPALALMPPLTEKELKNESNTIVKGKIIKIACTGKFKDTGCANLTGYKASLKVNEVLKGKKLENLNLFFNKYKFKNGCVGSPDAVHYEGEEALYYLKCKKENCHLTHWNGIDYIEKGTASLPKCKK